MTTSGPGGRAYVAALTGLRGVAAFAVFLFHYAYFNPGIDLGATVPFIGTALQFPMSAGFAGVDLFFVLSGFLLTLPFALGAQTGERRTRVGRYAMRRVRRVFPAYLAQLALILAVGQWFVTWRPLDGGELAAHAVMFFNAGPEPVRPLVGVWWTLPVELSFYLVLPLLAAFARPARWAALVLAGVAVSVVYRAWAVRHFGEAGADPVMLAANHLPGSLPEFLIGAGGAVLVQACALRGWRPPAWLPEALFLGGAALAVAWLWCVVRPNGGAYWSGHWSMFVAPTALGAALTGMVTGLYWGSRLGRWLLANPPVYFLGLISYSLYLWHFVVMQQLEAHAGEAYAAVTGFSRFLLTTAVVVVVSTLSWFLAERPFYRLGRRRVERRPGA